MADYNFNQGDVRQTNPSIQNAAGDLLVLDLVETSLWTASDPSIQFSDPSGRATKVTFTQPVTEAAVEWTFTQTQDGVVKTFTATKTVTVHASTVDANIAKGSFTLVPL